jgi:peptidoglycan hydrolase FlgJ
MANAVNLSLSPSVLGTVKTAPGDAAQQLKAKDKVVARQFESQFLNSMFEEMFTGVDGDGPAGGSGALKIWRSFMTDQYAKSFAASGGLGIASHVYNELLKQQGLTAS